MVITGQYAVHTECFRRDSGTW